VNGIKIEKLERREYGWGDWHDAPLGWRVVGPARENGTVELQKFKNRDEARLYARIRRAAVSEFEASRAYAHTA
jgi:hypothetical protein